MKFLSVAHRSHLFACRLCQRSLITQCNVLQLSISISLPAYDINRILEALCHEDDRMVSRACRHAGLWHVNDMPRPCLSAWSLTFTCSINLRKHDNIFEFQSFRYSLGYLPIYPPQIATVMKPISFCSMHIPVSHTKSLGESREWNMVFQCNI